jgi:hypothetical protein
MKLTNEQQEFIKKNLRDNLRYRETYEELYDHILTALDHTPEGLSFENTVNKIINDDFGGFNGLAMIEDRYQRTASSEIKRLYLMYVTKCLKLPLISVLVISMAAVYYMVCQPWFGYSTLYMCLLLINLIPVTLFYIRPIRTGYVWGRIKESVKNRGFLWLRYIPLAILLGVFGIIPWVFLEDLDPSHWFKNAPPAIITVILIAFMVHTVASYRVYRHDFKVSLPKK